MSKAQIIIMTDEQIAEEIEHCEIFMDLAVITGDEITSAELETLQLLKDEKSLREFNIWLEA